VLKSQTLTTLSIALLLVGCGTTGPPEGIRCNDRQGWGSYLGQDSQAMIKEILQAVESTGAALDDDQRAALTSDLKHITKWRLVRFMLLESQNHNFGTLQVPAVMTADGKPLRIYRTGFTSRPERAGSCFDSLLTAGGTRHVVNLYSGVMPTQDLELKEQFAAESAGGSYFTLRGLPKSEQSWRHDLKLHGDDPVVFKRAQGQIAKVINEQILKPDGKPPRGNVHVHCGGGMHRTGMVVGILERCFNGASADKIDRDYRHHTAYIDKERPGGFEQGNLDFIQAFDCSLLKP